MSAEAILALVGQGLAILPTLIQTGVDVVQRIEALSGLAKSASEGTQTQEQIDAVRNQTDADLAQFNADLPPEA
jgi:hypothetical protein